jgi:hypothetical protein
MPKFDKFIAVQYALVVDEGVESTFVYHLKREGEYVSLCGHKLPGKNLPLSIWGVQTHLHERYCSGCLKISMEVGRDGR